ncbi:PH domain-containing protein [Halomarina ordinaria]|uniref:PH domain-containing protein n=1 Tax=Halomarina ordinaria TaxID=3033939 RepID=A0ABD5U853_9EURY|nr:PH domain-containing protein [Halomarina sp. PSRA2]
MRLDPRSVPYRAGASTARLLWAVVVVALTSQLDERVGLTLAGGVVVLFAAAATYQLAYYRRFEYDLADDTFDIRSGVLSRRERDIPLRRIQNVDTSQNVVQQLLGITEVRLETAGGDETEAVLQYVSAAEATRLQDDISRLKRGDANGEREEGERGTHPERETVFAITPRELFLLGVVSLDLRLVPVFSVVAGVLVPSIAVSTTPFGPMGEMPMSSMVTSPLVAISLGTVALYALAAAASGVVTATNYYGFRLSRGPDELRYERGLFQRYTGTIPLAKVQSLTVDANALARLGGYASLTVRTAGYAPGDTEGAQSAVPFADRERVWALARSVEDLGEVSFERPPRRARTRYAARYLIGLALLTGAFYAVTRLDAVWGRWWLTAALVPFVPVAAHLKWRARGYALLDDHVVTRNGFFLRRTTVVPYHRVQTVSTVQTVFQRRRDLATLLVDAAGGSGADARAVDIDATVAEALRGTVEARLNRALAARREQRHRERTASLTDDP